MRLIDADALKAQIQSKIDPHNLSALIAAGAFMGEVDKAQTVDAAPRRFAHWEEEKDRERHWRCSNCQRVEGISCITMHYCPFCGAEMAEHPYVASRH